VFWRERERERERASLFVVVQENAPAVDEFVDGKQNVVEIFQNHPLVDLTPALRSIEEERDQRSKTATIQKQNEGGFHAKKKKKKTEAQKYGK
jgi:hypothetical protein